MINIMKYDVRFMNKGFTLIELLIVIAIIGVLTTIASVNFIGIRERARDAQRKSDLAQIQTALELYRTDRGLYPELAEYPGCDDPIQSQTSVYLKNTPCDPESGDPYDYRPSATQADYTLSTCLENENDKDRRIDATNSAGCSEGRVSYVVENP